MLRPSLIRSCQSRQAVLYSGVIRIPKEKRQPEDCPCLPLSAHVSPCHSPPHPGMPCPTEQSDAYRIPKHRTRCLRLLSAHVTPCPGSPCPAPPLRALPLLTSPSLTRPCEAIRFAKASVSNETFNAVDSPYLARTCLSKPCPAPPWPSMPDRANPRPMVSPPHSRLSLSGYRLFTALARHRPTAPRHDLPCRAG